MQEEKGSELMKKYGIKKNIQKVVDKIEVLGDGNFNIEWNNKLLVNNATVLRIKDGHLTIKLISVRIS